MGEAAYKKNITIHRATSRSPYELLFGIVPHTHTITSADQEEEPAIECAEEPNEGVDYATSLSPQQPHTDHQEQSLKDSDKNWATSKRKVQEDISSHVRKQMKTQTNDKQNKYNEKMKSARPKVKQFDIHDYVCERIYENRRE